MSLPSFLYDFGEKHVEVFILFGLAIVMTMPPQLPSPFNRFDLLNWMYIWLHDALRAFANSRQPAAIARTESHMTVSEDGKKETSSSSVAVAGAVEGGGGKTEHP